MHKGEPQAGERAPLREPLERLDTDPDLRRALLPFCRLEQGEVWKDPVSGHRVGVLDATSPDQVTEIVGGVSPPLCIADPPYNLRLRRSRSAATGGIPATDYDRFTRGWLDSLLSVLAPSASFYAWLGADVRNGLHPIPEFIAEMRGRSGWEPRNWITMRNQRGYGTQKNWMWVRQELFYYARGTPHFDVAAEYTDIPKILRGYYKEITGERTENAARGKADTIRAGNVWVDIQQVFYRLHENVPGCYAQKPLKAFERIVRSATAETDWVIDPFAHSGTTLLACERTGRRAITFDIDPVFAEIAIRRLERFRRTGREGWQCENPFPELAIEP
ncbi:MAG: DNA-methyltransferase [Sphingomonadales bacterium]